VILLWVVPLCSWAGDGASGPRIIEANGRGLCERIGTGEGGGE